MLPLAIRLRHAGIRTSHPHRLHALLPSTFTHSATILNSMASLWFVCIRSAPVHLTLGSFSSFACIRLQIDSHLEAESSLVSYIECVASFYLTLRLFEFLSLLWSHCSNAMRSKRRTLRSAVTRKISEAQMVSRSPVTKSMPQLLFSMGIELFVIVGDNVQQSRFTSRLGAYSAIPRSTLFR